MMVKGNRDVFIKHFLNVENNLLLFLTKNKESILITNKNIIDINTIGGNTYAFPLYINKEESNLSL